MTKTEQDIPTEADDHEAHSAGDSAVIKDTISRDDGSAKPLSNADIVFTLSEYEGASPTIEKTDDDSGVRVKDAANGELHVELQPSDTEGLGDPTNVGGVKTYYYEIRVRDDENDIAMVTTGDFVIKATSASFN